MTSVTQWTPKYALRLVGVFTHDERPLLTTTGGTSVCDERLLTPSLPLESLTLHRDSNATRAWLSLGLSSWSRVLSPRRVLVGVLLHLLSILIVSFLLSSLLLLSPLFFYTRVYLNDLAWLLSDHARQEVPVSITFARISLHYHGCCTVLTLALKIVWRVFND